MIKKPSPLTQMTIAMVLLCTMLVIMADLFFGVLHAGDNKERLAKEQVGRALSVQIASLLRHTDRSKLGRVIDEVVSSSTMFKSVGLRDAGGDLLVLAGDHLRQWKVLDEEALLPNQMIVELKSSDQVWGQVEIVFFGEPPSYSLSFLRDPMITILLFIVLLGGPAFWFYMRRAMQYLDPASVIPTRVQAAFDTMSEGVVVLDNDGRILLASRVFRAMNPTENSVKAGVTLSSVSWLACGLSTDASQHPWIKAMNENANQSGQTLELSSSFGTQHLVVTCSPICEDKQSVRGCMVTFSDVSELHRANEALLTTNHTLSDSKLEIERQNVELQRLATRDPLTGCLNRRALFDAFEKLVVKAHSENTPISCLILDIDYFKKVNDSYGHGIGDRVIQEVSRRMLESTRSTDLVCRYGGEEFCVVLPGMSVDGAIALGDRIRARIEERAGRAVRELDNLQVTVSVGVDCATGQEIDMKQLIDRADQALYVAKRSGRNQVRLFSQDETRDLMNDSVSLAGEVSDDS